MTTTSILNASPSPQPRITTPPTGRVTGRALTAPAWTTQTNQIGTGDESEKFPRRPQDPARRPQRPRGGLQKIHCAAHAPDGTIMYHGGSRRSPENKNNDRRWKEYHAHSPTHSHTHPYSPSNGTYPHSPYTQYSALPSTTPTMTAPSTRSPHTAPLPSPKMNGASIQTPGPPPSSTTSTRYDPLSEHREGNASRKLNYEARSPTQVRKNFTTSPSKNSDADMVFS